MLVHINFGLLTSPGVRAAFLDEIFKASSSILNSLLTLVLEREYFNWGGMRKSNLVMLIGASNELPGSLAAAGGGSEDFNLLHAFLDRFPLRLDVPNPSPHAPAGKHAEDSNLAEATRYALRRERDRFNDSQHPGKERATVATVDDVLAAGRDIMDVALGDDGTPLFAGDLRKFKREFFRIATSLWQSDRSGEPTWTLSPRKLKALYKIALAHAYVTGSPDDAAVGKKAIAGPGSRDLHVFDFIADSALHRNILQDRVSTMIKPEAS
jgi:MoxR-like ATPase